MAFMGCTNFLVETDDDLSSNPQVEEVENNEDSVSTDNQDDGLGKSEEYFSSINLSYMKDLVIDIDNSTAFGIKKVEINKNTSTVLENNSSVSLLNASLVLDAEDEPIQKNFLYTTTEIYENGNVEYNDDRIKKVTFKKNTLVQENVYDSNDNLIDSNKIVTQEEIPAQINRLYVSEKYIFMQFVALVSESGSYDYMENNEIKSEYIELRPVGLTYDENGISDFDLKNYYSSALSQSFVVDLSNGNIYKIENFNIATIHDVDIVKDDNGNYYKMSINNQRELMFVDIMPNKDVSIKGVKTDKYGYTFVMNDKSINEKDDNNKIIYTSNYRHVFSKGSIMYTLKPLDDVSVLDKQYIDGELVDIDNNSKIYGLKLLHATLSMNSPVFYYKGFNLHDFYPANKYTTMNGNLKLDSNLSKTGTYPDWFIGDSHYIYFVYKEQIYYKHIILEDYFTNETTLYIEDFSLVSDKKLYPTGYYMNVGQDKLKINNVFYETTLNGTNYYQLIERDNDFDLRLLQNKEYTQNIFILQPIN
jgi:hypothetical protein